MLRMQGYVGKHEKNQFENCAMARRAMDIVHFVCS